jgi:CDP-diglyceride synthetase
MFLAGITKNLINQGVIMKAYKTKTYIKNLILTFLVFFAVAVVWYLINPSMEENKIASILLIIIFICMAFMINEIIILKREKARLKVKLLFELRDTYKLTGKVTKYIEGYEEGEKNILFHILHLLGCRGSLETVEDIDKLIKEVKIFPAEPDGEEQF